MLVFKGFIIGLLMLIPGSSGGTIAITLGIYEEILSRFSCFFKNFKDNIWFFSKLILGGIIGLFLAAIILIMLLDSYYNFLLYSMLFIVTWMLSRHFKSYYQSLKWYQYSYLLIGFVIMLGFNNLKTINVINNDLIFLMAGILLAIAFILPGISFSYVLVLLNMYEPFIMAIASLDYVFLGKLGIAFAIGLILSAKLINWLFQKYSLAMNNLVCGFIMASVFIAMDKNNYFLCWMMVLLGLLFASIKHK